MRYELALAYRLGEYKADHKLVKLIKDLAIKANIDVHLLELNQQTEEGLQIIYAALYEHSKTIQNESIDPDLLERFALAGYVDHTHGDKVIYGDNAVTELRRFYRIYETVIPNRGFNWDDYGSTFRLSFIYKVETEEKLVFCRLKAMPLRVQNERETPKGSSLPSDWKSGFKSTVHFDLFSGNFEDCEIIEGYFIPDSPREDYHHISTVQLLAEKQDGHYYVMDHKNKRYIRIPDTFKMKGEVISQNQALRERFAKQYQPSTIVYLRNVDLANIQTTKIERLARIEATNAQLGYPTTIKKAKSKMSSGGKNPNSFSTNSLGDHRTDHMVDLKSRSYTLPEIREENGRKLPRLKFNLTLSDCGSLVYYNSRNVTSVVAKVIRDNEGYITLLPVALNPLTHTREWQCLEKYLGFTHANPTAPKYDELGKLIPARGSSQKLQEIQSLLTPHVAFSGIHAQKVERKAKKNKQQKVSIR